MGGEGSGRRADPVTQYRNSLQFNQPQPNDGSQIFLPNLSGVRPEARKDTTTALDHATLSNLSWINSAHTGTASRFASFDSSNIAVVTKLVPSGAVVGDTDVQTFTNKSYDLANNTLTGTSGGFNTACSDADFSYTTHTHANYTSGGIVVIFDGGGAVLASGAIIDVMVPFRCTLTAVTLLPDVSGSVTVGVWKDTYANFPPTIADTMFSGGIFLSAASKFQDTTLTLWNKAINDGDTIRFNVSGASTTLTKASIIMSYTRP